MQKTKIRQKYTDFLELPNLIMQKFPWITKLNKNIRTSTLSSALIYKITTDWNCFSSNDKFRQDF